MINLHILLTKTWIYSDKMKLYHIENFNCYSNCNDYRSGKIAIFIKKNVKIQFEKILLVTIDGLKVNFSLNEITICIMYRFHNMSVNY